jgi:Zn-dependent protease
MIITFIAFIIAITIHEAAHAWMSDRLGDPTAKLGGRLSLNPIAHIDLYGTIIVPLILTIIGSPFIFGWAKPVMFDPFNLKNPRKDSALISLAGPASNLLLAILLAVLLRLSGLLIFGSFWTNLAAEIISINVVLAIFNLIPIHPLDGGKIFVGLLPEKDAHEADFFLQRYGTFILIMLIFPLFNGTSPISLFLYPVVNFILKILLGGTMAA